MAAPSDLTGGGIVGGGVSGQDLQAEEAGLPPAERRRRRLQRFLLSSLQNIEAFVQDARHLWIIPQSSVLDKSPRFRDAMSDRTKHVRLSRHFEEFLRAERQGLPREDEMRPRNKPRFAVRRAPGLPEVIAAYVGLIWVLVKSPIG